MEPCLSELHQLGFAVVGVDQDAVWQHFDALPGILHSVGDLDVAIRPEPHLEHLAAAVLANQCRRRTLGHDLALVDDDQPV